MRQMAVVIPRTAEKKIVGYIICNTLAFCEVFWWALLAVFGLHFARSSRDSWGRQRRSHQRAAAVSGTQEEGPVAGSCCNMGSSGMLMGSHQRDSYGWRKRMVRHIWCCCTERAVRCHSEDSWGRAPGPVLQGTCLLELLQQPR